MRLGPDVRLAGALSKKDKFELLDVALVLGFSLDDSASKETVYKEVKGHFDANPGLKSDLRFAQIFSRGQRPGPVPSMQPPPPTASSSSSRSHAAGVVQPAPLMSTQLLSPVGPSGLNRAPASATPHINRPALTSHPVYSGHAFAPYSMHSMYSPVSQYGT